MEAGTALCSQVRKPRPKLAKHFAQGHPASKEQSPELPPPSYPSNGIKIAACLPAPRQCSEWRADSKVARPEPRQTWVQIPTFLLCGLVTFLLKDSGPHSLKWDCYLMASEDTQEGLKLQCPGECPPTPIPQPTLASLTALHSQCKVENPQ